MSDLLNWTNNLPTGWGALPLKALASYRVSSVDKIVKEEEISVELCNYTDVYKNDFITSKLEFMKGSATNEEIHKFSLQIGDVLITKDSESWDDIAIPALVKNIKPNLLCGYHLAIIRPRDKRLLPEYLFRCFQSKEIRIQLELASTGVTRYGLPKDEIGRLLLPIPDIKTQKSIVTYLDNEIEFIDSLVAEKENLITLLTKKRQSLITQAVTKGINSKVKFRNSGIDWLGEVPEHWETERTRWLFKEKNDRSEKGEEEMLTVSHITGVTPRSEKDVNMFEAETNEGYKKCNAGDLVINTLWAWMGAMGVAPISGIVSPAYHVYTPLARILPEYVDTIVRLPLFANEVIRYSKGVWSSRLRLYPDGFYEVYMPVPPIEEQKQITKHIEVEIDRMKKMERITKLSIELLKERKGVLISKAVTGQLEIPLLN
ncbi:MAG: restriction endonuclease subunit S [Chitinophagaceae bacterium]|jgi:type I restriction enzyme S subunit|nr:restriction endonuclease subunit S [Chitinophagaceae bacterium]